LNKIFGKSSQNMPKHAKTSTKHLNFKAQNIYIKPHLEFLIAYNKPRVETA
jgi:hypothetical protein